MDFNIVLQAEILPVLAPADVVYRDRVSQDQEVRKVKACTKEK